MNSSFLKSTLLVSSLTFAACGPTASPAEEEGCEHLEQGPWVAVTATTGSATAPPIKEDHHRYDVALVDVAGGKGGRVRFAAPAEAKMEFFLGTSVPFQVLDSSEQSVAIEKSATGSAACTQIKAFHLVSMKVATYTLVLGPTPEGSVSIVVEEASP